MTDTPQVLLAHHLKDIYPYLPRANVATTAAASYMSLLGGGAS